MHATLNVVHELETIAQKKTAIWDYNVQFPSFHFFLTDVRTAAYGDFDDRMNQPGKEKIQ